MVSKKYLQEELEKGFPDASFIQVESSDDVHFSSVIVSQTFDHQPLVDRHRQVYRILGDLIGSQALHALSLKMYTPEEWSRQNG